MLNWTRLSCHGFVANQVRLQLFMLAYNLGNFLRRLGLPKAVKDWSLRSLQVKLIKMGGRIVRHARRIVFKMAEVAVPRALFAATLEQVRGYAWCLAKRPRSRQVVGEKGAMAAYNFGKLVQDPAFLLLCCPKTSRLHCLGVFSYAASCHVSLLVTPSFRQRYRFR